MISKITLIALIAFAVVYVHEGSKPIRDNMQSESACLEAAKGRAETDACISRMKLNIAQERSR